MSEDDKKSQDGSSAEPDAKQQELSKLKALSDRIKKAEAQNDHQSQSPSEAGRFVGQMGLMRIGTDFASAVLGATGAGWLLDYGLGTRPWGMLMMLLVGFCTGVMMIWRALQKSGTDDKLNRDVE